MQNTLTHISYFGVPFILALLLTPLVRRFALRHNLVSHPRPDRWHKQPTALLGGVGIYFAFLISVFYLGTFNRNALGLIIGGTFLFIVGLLDDRLHFAPYLKLFAQIIAGCIAIYFGNILGFSGNYLLVASLTLFWIIAITNAFNLLDNIDGLAAGIALVCSAMLFFSSLGQPLNSLGIYGLIISGAVLGFLPYNFNPAKIFMGDSGSMFLGYSLAVLAIAGTTRHLSSLIVTMLVPVLILSVPIFDTIFVMISRKIQGRKIFEGGKDHTSHRLIVLGLSQRKTVILLCSISALFGIVAISFVKLNAFLIITSAVLGAVILLFLGLFLYEVTLRDTQGKNNYKSGQGDGRDILNRVFLHKRRIIEVLLDLVMICIAYYSAYFLRFEGNLLSNNLSLFKESLIWIILIKMSAFFIFGFYRGVWRYVSISDLLTIFKTVSLSSIFSILFLTFLFRFQEYSRAVFFIDWVLLLFLIAGTRLLFRVLGEFFSRAREKGRNILIFGAGDMGEMVIREIKRNKTLNYNPIGFIDDDISKIGNKIQGVKVLGSRNKISLLANTYNVEEVLIAVPSINIDDLAEIAKICKNCGVNYRKIRALLDDKEDFAEFGKN